MRKVAKHPWHELDVESGLLVRQMTNRFRNNRWEIKNIKNNSVVILTDEEFEGCRSGVFSIPWWRAK